MVGALVVATLLLSDRVDESIASPAKQMRPTNCSNSF